MGPVHGLDAPLTQAPCKTWHAPYREVQDVGQLCQPIQDQGNEGKGNVGAEDAKGGDCCKVAEELLLLHRQPCVEDDGRQQVSVNQQCISVAAMRFSALICNPLDPKASLTC